jgi:hypothetical protein
VQRDAHLDPLVHERPQPVKVLRRNSVNGVISNGLAPRMRSSAGSVISVNCTWHDGHDVRRLERVAAGIEHEIRQLAVGGRPLGVLPEPRQQRLVELQPRWFTSR